MQVELGERLAGASKIFLAGDRLVAVLVIAVEAALLALLLARLRRGGRRGGAPFARCGRRPWRDRKGVVWGQSVSVRVDLGGRRLTTNKTRSNHIPDVNRY